MLRIKPILFQFIVQQDTSNGNIPNVVAGLQGREALWRVQAEQKDGDRYPRSYRVRAVSDDVEVIKAYKDKWASNVRLLSNIF